MRIKVIKGQADSPASWKCCWGLKNKITFIFSTSFIMCSGIPVHLQSQHLHNMLCITQICSLYSNLFWHS